MCLTPRGSAMVPVPYNKHVLVDYYAKAIERHGSPEHAVRVLPAEAERYCGRLPNGLLR